MSNFTELAVRTDVAIVVGYMAAMLLVAWRVSDGSRDVEGYTVGNRSLPGWVVGLSVLGTFLSSITFLGLPAKTYESDWNAYAFTLALVPAAWIAGRWFVPLYRGEVNLSAYEFLEQRFGTWARVYAVLSYVALQLTRVAMVLLLVSLPMVKLLDWPVERTLVLLGAIVIVYDALGGIRAVIWTDVFQVLILLVGAVWCLALLVGGWPGGAGEFLAALPGRKVSLGSWASLDLAATTVLVTFLYGLTENLRNYGTDQNYVQRMLAARSEPEAKKSIWIGAVSYLPVSVLFCLIGTAIYMHEQVAPTLGGSALVAGASPRPDQAFPNFIGYGLPQPVAGIVIAAILAAAMSTIDSSLNSMSTVVLVDVIRPLRRWRPRLPEIYTLRLSTVLLGVLGTTAAVAFYRVYQEQAATIMDLWWHYAGVAGGGLFGLFLLAWLFPWVPRWCAGVAVASTLPVLAWGTLLRGLPEESAWHWLNCPLHPYLVGISGTVVLLVVGVGLALPCRR